MCSVANWLTRGARGGRAPGATRRGPSPAAAAICSPSRNRRTWRPRRAFARWCGVSSVAVVRKAHWPAAEGRDARSTAGPRHAVADEVNEVAEGTERLRKHTPSDPTRPRRAPGAEAHSVNELDYSAPRAGRRTASRQPFADPRSQRFGRLRLRLAGGRGTRGHEVGEGICPCSFTPLRPATRSGRLICVSISRSGGQGGGIRCLGERDERWEEVPPMGRGRLDLAAA
jgi:hypothetical protein